MITLIKTVNTCYALNTILNAFCLLLYLISGLQVAVKRMKLDDTKMFWKLRCYGNR
jgi:hypothetical protein